MKITEYEGASRVLAECDKCGFKRWLHNPSTVQMLHVRCDCRRKAVA